MRTKNPTTVLHKEGAKYENRQQLSKEKKISAFYDISFKNVDKSWDDDDAFFIQDVPILFRNCAHFYTQWVLKTKSLKGTVYTFLHK